MTIHYAPTNQSFGSDLRSLRKARGLTLVGLAERLNRSVGWMSQVERDISQPTLSELRRFADVLDVPLSLFLKTTSDSDEDGYVVRAGARRSIGHNKTGLSETLVSPDLSDDFEVVHSVFDAGSEITQAVTRDTQEVAYIISGAMRVWVGNREFNLNAGDSFRVRGEPFRWANPYETPCIAIWIIAPPVY